MVSCVVGLCVFWLGMLSVFALFTQIASFRCRGTRYDVFLIDSDIRQHDVFFLGFGI